jgi:DNA-binding GntR family transcriptional regulator
MRQDILRLDLAPGSALRVHSLSERYGIGLTPVRECLNRLSTEQLVIPEHNKGFRVAQLSLDGLLDLEQSRSTIEGKLFFDAITHGDDAWEATVVGSFHHLSRSPVPSILQDDTALEDWTRYHERFHNALIAAAPSPLMQRFRKTITDRLGRYYIHIQNGLRDLAQTKPDQAERAAQVFATSMELAPHQRLYDVALNRDADAAMESFAGHSSISTQAFLQLGDLLQNNGVDARSFQEALS